MNDSGENRARFPQWERYAWVLTVVWTLVGQIGESDAPLATALANLVAHYRFDRLQALMGEVEQ